MIVKALLVIVFNHNEQLKGSSELLVDMGIVRRVADIINGSLHVSNSTASSTSSYRLS